MVPAHMQEKSSDCGACIAEFDARGGCAAWKTNSAKTQVVGTLFLPRLSFRVPPVPLCKCVAWRSLLLLVAGPGAPWLHALW